MMNTDREITFHHNKPAAAVIHDFTIKSLKSTNKLTGQLKPLQYLRPKSPPCFLVDKSRRLFVSSPSGG